MSRNRLILLQQIDRIVDDPVVQRVFGQHRFRQRNTLQRFGAAAAGHDDRVLNLGCIFGRIFVCRLFLRLRIGKRAGQQGGRQNRKRNGTNKRVSSHKNLP